VTNSKKNSHPASGRPMREDLVRAAVLEVYASVRSERQLADRALDRLLRRERRLYSTERRTIGERLFELLRQERRLDFALFGRAVPQGSPSFIYGARYAALLVAQGEDPSEVLRSQGLSPTLSAALGRVREPLPENLSPVERVAIEGSLPDFLAERLVNDLGAEEALGFARAIGERAPLTVRANSLRVDRDELARRLSDEGVRARPTRLSPLGLQLESRVNVFGLATFKEGLFEVQDEGSQLLALLLQAQPGEHVADTCAGAGGKTLELAAEMCNRGELWALDVDPRRLQELSQRARRAGAHNIRSRTIAADEAAEAQLSGMAGKFDRVLIDAPCSGLGALRRSPDARYRFEPEDFSRYAARQKVLIARFARLVRPGGRMVYATCSVAREDNEAIVEGFLASGAPFRLLPSADALPPEAREATAGSYLKLLPQRHGTDGFFAALLERQGSGPG
jgi:16S rRNA (cytosine967-C5)-methyltransferase